MYDIRLFIEIVGLLSSAIIASYLTILLEKRPRLIAGTTNAAHIRINEEGILSNHTLIVRNDGKKEARNVQIMHINLPKMYQVLPAVNYKVETLKDGTALIFPTLVPGEEITICYMYPENMFGKIHGIIKHDQGQAEWINILLTREYSQLRLKGMKILMLIGLIAIFYCLCLSGLYSWNYLLTLNKNY